MKIECVKVGRLEENCYILSINDKCIIIDPGDEFNLIKSKISDKNVLKVLITHKHFDHIGALYDIINMYKVEYMDFDILEEKEYEMDEFKFKVIKTPGHTEDSVTYYFYQDNLMFVGDFIFKGTIGRVDLEGGNYNKMNSSIEKIKTYPSDIVIYPGHGDKTTLKEEKINNPYF